MKDEFGLPRLKGILPTGGTGTLSSYYKKDSGYIYAKTGSLSGVVALSGYLITKKNRLLIFSVLINNNSDPVVRRKIEKFLEGIREKY
jgi:D-alanyl-D-alanine carboxypeptidase/D-alanyl-D-alanine-endopeptidase (penicillin-binding protein 4)